MYPASCYKVIVAHAQALGLYLSNTNADNINRESPKARPAPLSKTKSSVTWPRAQTPGTAHQQRVRVVCALTRRKSSRKRGVRHCTWSECIRFAGDPQGWLMQCRILLGRLRGPRTRSLRHLRLGSSRRQSWPRACAIMYIRTDVRLHFLLS
jgi:hypothetical protein